MEHLFIHLIAARIVPAGEYMFKENKEDKRYSECVSEAGTGGVL